MGGKAAGGGGGGGRGDGNAARSASPVSVPLLRALPDVSSSPDVQGWLQLIPDPRGASPCPNSWEKQRGRALGEELRVGMNSRLSRERAGNEILNIIKGNVLIRPPGVWVGCSGSDGRDALVWLRVHCWDVLPASLSSPSASNALQGKTV